MNRVSELRIRDSIRAEEIKELKNKIDRLIYRSERKRPTVAHN
jgi:hypothetical protein